MSRAFGAALALAAPYGGDVARMFREMSTQSGVPHSYHFRRSAAKRAKLRRRSHPHH